MMRRLLVLAGVAAALWAAGPVIPLVAQPPRPLIPPDIAGEWNLTNNEEDTTAQPPLGDYLGIPFNDGGPHAVRHDGGIDLGHARVSVPAALGAAPVARPRRRAHPQGTGSADARGAARITSSSCARSTGRSSWTAARIRRRGRRTRWTGFSTGEWVGNTLKITTTHLKDGYLKRGGPQTSDMFTMTEYLTRHDDILTIVTVVDDPIYQDEPYVESTTYTYRPDVERRDGNLQRVVVRRERRHRPAPRPALPPGPEHRARRVAEEGRLDSRRADARRREDDLSRNTARRSTAR